jgi:hypothetical protein
MTWTMRAFWPWHRRWPPSRRYDTLDLCVNGELSGACVTALALALTRLCGLTSLSLTVKRGGETAALEVLQARLPLLTSLKSRLMPRPFLTRLAIVCAIPFPA